MTSPELVILGDSPVADALATLAAPLGFRVAKSLDDISTPHDAWVVVAALHSAEDHPAVRAALTRGLGYVAMVASRRRTDTFVAELRAEGVPDEIIQRLKSPAGLNIGAATNPEIALSILAEIVQHRRARP